MPSLFRNLFAKSNVEDSPEMEKSNAEIDCSPTTDSKAMTTGESMLTTTSGQSIEKEAMEMHHVRANMQQRWVSAEDFMSFADPTLTDPQIQYATIRLMHQAYIKAQWPPNKATPSELQGQFRSCSIRQSVLAI